MHDRNGNPLNIGDKVNVPCTITQLNPDVEGQPPNLHCNITLKCDVDMAGNPYTLTLNAGQTELVEQ